ncbi:ADP-ribosylglycohydrolase family protein [Burkholderia aenigmatica]|uniref:Uncharacterized protein n=1 Tax=Burkholderia aenigmatica TaxID=2015348 RepID=A0A228J1N1_9BURK|nr:hypothetical protein CFB84_07110 [Burkholderia aenigmatica]
MLDTIWSARKATEQDSFEDVARTAIPFVQDAKTTAVVACGLAGIKFGIDGIPARGPQQLRGFEIAESLINNMAQNTTQA